jgi:hypothetical protein
MAVAKLRCLRLLSLPAAAGERSRSFVLFERDVDHFAGVPRVRIAFVVVSLGFDIRGIRAIRGLEKMR